MATVNNNNITKALSGRIGNIVFRQRNGKTVAYSLPRPYPPPTRLQQDRRRLFAMAVAKARQALKVPAQQSFIRKLAKKGQSTYHAAVSYFLHQLQAAQNAGRSLCKRPNSVMGRTRSHVGYITNSHFTPLQMLNSRHFNGTAPVQHGFP